MYSYIFISYFVRNTLQFLQEIFLQGEVISVIRRVDENWAEGKLLDRIGIFPLAFVELNSVARALMKLSTK